MLRTILFAFTLPTAATALGAFGALGAQKRQPNCALSTDASTRLMLENLKSRLVDPSLGGWRAHSKLPTVDTAAVVAVHSDSLCQRAGALVYRGGTDDPPPGKLFLFKVGPVYWARDRSRVVGEWTQNFTLDSTLTRVVSVAAT